STFACCHSIAALPPRGWPWRRRPTIRTPASSTTVSAGPAELWLRALQRLTATVAHELRNPLNGVALNLEVLRGRVGRTQLDPATLTGLAEAAGPALA